ncbi:hypothetical protein ACQJBY_016790 [Aegilops geniculata]
MEESSNFFHHKILELWNKQKDVNGEAYLPAIYINPMLLSVVQKKYLTSLLHDSLGFCSVRMIRLGRLLGEVSYVLKSMHLCWRRARQRGHGRAPRRLHL